MDKNRGTMEQREVTYARKVGRRQSRQVTHRQKEIEKAVETQMKGAEAQGEELKKLKAELEELKKGSVEHQPARNDGHRRRRSHGRIYPRTLGTGYHPQRGPSDRRGAEREEHRSARHDDRYVEGKYDVDSRIDDASTVEVGLDHRQWQFVRAEASVDAEKFVKSRRGVANGMLP